MRTKHYECKMSNYIEQNPPYPKLEDRRSLLLKQLYDAEFEDNAVKAMLLKDEIERIERRMMFGEIYELPF